MTEINSTSTSNAEKLIYTGEIAVAQDEYYIRLAEENDEMTRHEKKKKIGLDLNMILLLLRAVLMDGDGDIGEATKRLLVGLLKMFTKANIETTSQNVTDKLGLADLIGDEDGPLKEKLEALEKRIEDMIDDASAAKAEDHDTKTESKDEDKNLERQQMTSLLVDLFKALEESENGTQLIKDSVQLQDNDTYLVEFAGTPDSKVEVPKDSVMLREGLSTESSVLIQAFLQSAEVS